MCAPQNASAHSHIYVYSDWNCSSHAIEPTRSCLFLRARAKRYNYNPFMNINSRVDRVRCDLHVMPVWRCAKGGPSKCARARQRELPQLLPESLLFLYIYHIYAPGMGKHWETSRTGAKATRETLQKWPSFKKDGCTHIFPHTKQYLFLTLARFTKWELVDFLDVAISCSWPLSYSSSERHFRARWRFIYMRLH